MDLCSCRRIRQALLCDTADDLMPEWRVSENRSGKEDHSESNYEPVASEIHQRAATIRTSATHQESGIAMQIHRMRSRQFSKSNPDEITSDQQARVSSLRCPHSHTIFEIAPGRLSPLIRPRLRWKALIKATALVLERR